jgi:hypothetical protein
VILNPARRPYTAILATRWLPHESGLAMKILLQAQVTMRRLRSVSDTEQTSSVPGFAAVIKYRLQAPDRLAYRTYAVRGHRPPALEGQAVEIGAASWVRQPGSQWQRQAPEGTLPFATNTWFTWSTYAQATRLVSIDARHTSHPRATIVLMDPGTPAWWTLTIDLRTSEVLHGVLLTPGHVEAERFAHANSTPKIRAPIGGRR